MDEMQKGMPQPKKRREILGAAGFCWFFPREQLLKWHMAEASFCLLLPAWSERDLLLQMFPESSFWNVMGDSSFSCFYLVLRRPVRSSCLEELCWRAESTRKIIKCLPASPL